MLTELTITVDEELLRRALEVAGSCGSCLEEMLRDYLRTLVGETTGKEAAADLLELLTRHGGHSGGWKVEREDAYQIG